VVSNAERAVELLSSLPQIKEVKLDGDIWTSPSRRATRVTA
jgi:hypothetical protein